MVMNSPTTPVFGLTKADLWPVVEAAAGEPVADFEIAIEHEVHGPYGFAAEKVIPTFRYVTREGRTGEVVIFAKHPYRAHTVEPEQYRFLHAHGMAVPKLYGTLPSPEGRRVLFLEYLPPKPRPANRLEYFLPQVELMARFAAICPSDEYAAWMQANCECFFDGFDSGEKQFAPMWAQALRGELGPEFQGVCAEHRDAVPRLGRHAREAKAAAAALPQGLVHTDFSRENVGRRGTGEFVLMDLESVTLGPRFYDISYCLAWPGVKWHPEVNVNDLAQHFLDTYARAGGGVVSPEELWEEVHALRHAYILTMLNWVYQQARAQPDDSPQDAQRRQEHRTGLLAWMRLLLAQGEEG